MNSIFVCLGFDCGIKLTFISGVPRVGQVGHVSGAQFKEGRKIRILLNLKT